jgi:hypothetical protein
LACACADVEDTEVEDSDIQSASQALFTTSTGKFWSNAATIPVCFQPDETEWTDNYEHYLFKKSQIQGWIEDAYESIPNVAINFTGWQDCANLQDFIRGDEGADKVEIYLNTDGGADSTHNVLRIPPAAAQNIVLHEVMHVLGFNHECDRTDAPSTPGEWTRELKAQYMECLADDIMWDHWDKTPESPLWRPTCDPENTRMDHEGVYFTPYDFWSIANSSYCHCRDELSELDKLGLEMSYPTSASLSNSPVHFENGFRVESGIVGFENLVLRDDWFARGGLPAGFGSGGVNWTKLPDSRPTFDHGPGFQVSESGNYVATSTDVRGHGRSSETVTVTISPSKAAGLVMAVL